MKLFTIPLSLLLGATCASAEENVQLLRTGTAHAVSVETAQPVCPAFIRQEFNPVLGFHVTIDGSEGTALLEGIELGFGGTTRMQDIE